MMKSDCAFSLIDFERKHANGLCCSSPPLSENLKLREELSELFQLIKNYGMKHVKGMIYCKNVFEDHCSDASIVELQ